MTSSPEGLPQELLRLSSHYRSGSSDLGEEFFAPCLRHCTRYSRAAAYFSTDALASWVGALPRLVRSSKTCIRLLIAPVLSEADLHALRAAVQAGESRNNLRQEVADDLLKRLLEELEPMRASDLRREVFAWLIANGRLTLRFALPTHFDGPTVFHEKIGVFEFDNGASLAFTGSANETAGGHRRNYESIDVFRSWVPSDQERVTIKAEEFEDAWGGEAVGLAVVDPSPEVLDKVKTYSPRTDPLIDHFSEREPPSSTWQHQDEAIAAFLECHRGVLEMATGTGKTRTALRIYSRLLEIHEVDSLIVATDGTDLLRQWFDEISGWITDPQVSIYRHFDRYHELGRYLAHPQDSVLIVSREKLSATLAGVDLHQRAGIMLIHDEVHGLGSPQNRRELTGQHASFPYVLGLSATPERAYDEEGNQFIQDEVGPVFYQFGLEEAIERGILCEFVYEPLPYELTSGDRQRLQAIYALQAVRNKEGSPMPKEELWRRLSDVYKTAEDKIPTFIKYLRDHPSVLSNAIIFVHGTAYGERLLDTIHGYTRRYSTYYSDDDREHLEAFSQGKLDCLITCHRLSQGIDVRGLRTVVLFASDRSKLETIQRMGRCLRSDPANPNKKALVIDFVRGDEDEGASAPMSADAERCQWLERLSQTRKVR